MHKSCGQRVLHSIDRSSTNNLSPLTNHKDAHSDHFFQNGDKNTSLSEFDGEFSPAMHYTKLRLNDPSSEQRQEELSPD